MPRRASTGPTVVTIYWRDIPAQVNGQVGRERHQFVLSAKFQRAIDRARRKARIDTAAEDVAQWRRASSPCSADVSEAAAATAARLESEYSRDYLGRLAFAGGHASALGGQPADHAELLALEELDGDDERGDPGGTP